MQRPRITRSSLAVSLRISARSHVHARWSRGVPLGFGDEFSIHTEGYFRNTLVNTSPSITYLPFAGRFSEACLKWRGVSVGQQASRHATLRVTSSELETAPLATQAHSDFQSGVEPGVEREENLLVLCSPISDGARLAGTLGRPPFANLDRAADCSEGQACRPAPSRRGNRRCHSTAAADR